MRPIKLKLYPAYCNKIDIHFGGTISSASDSSDDSEVSDSSSDSIQSTGGGVGASIAKLLDDKELQYYFHIVKEVLATMFCFFHSSNTDISEHST